MRVRLDTFDVEPGVAARIGHHIGLDRKATRPEIREYLAREVAESIAELRREHELAKVPELPFPAEATT